MLGAVSAIWGASYLLIKIALDGIEPMMIVFARVLLAALLLYVVIQMREERSAPPCATCASGRCGPWDWVRSRSQSRSR